MVNIRRALIAAIAAAAGAVGTLTLTALAPARPQAAPADCGGVREATPAHWRHHQRPPLAIGDSTMLLALYELAAIGYDANAHGCRQVPEALSLIEARKADGTLPHMVVVALGADGSVTHAEVGQMLGVLCCTRLLVLVTPRELGGGSGSDAVTVREEVGRHSGRAKLLDWVAYSSGHPEWFQPDGLHLTTDGANAFTRLLARALPWAYPKPPHKKRRRPHKPVTTTSTTTTTSTVSTPTPTSTTTSTTSTTTETSSAPPAPTATTGG